jgi:hypothetical protein
MSTASKEGSKEPDDDGESDDDLLRSSVSYMSYCGWSMWPKHVPRQPGYKYSDWVGYDLKAQLWSKPSCSPWLRIKYWIWSATPPANEPDGG